MDKCIDHLNFTNETCPDCNLSVDEFGNTENQFTYCSFPCCGCDGARLCMASDPSENAVKGNVEGMWSKGKDKQAREAVFHTMSLCEKLK